MGRGRLELRGSKIVPRSTSGHRPRHLRRRPAPRPRLRHEPRRAQAQPLRYTYAGDRLTSAVDPDTGTRRYAFAYDDRSNLSAVSSYAPDGVSIAATLCLRHDALSRLTLVGLASPGAAGPDALACRSDAEVAEPLARFQYDARNRRVARWSASSGEWTQYVLGPDGSTLAELVRPTSPGGAWSVSRDYVWLDSRPIAQVEYPGPAGSAEGHVFSVHTDAIGLPRALSNRAGQVVWRAEARPYGDIGEVTSADPLSGRTVVTNLRLPGQYDERLLTSLGIQGPYYNWNRWYLPAMGRYLELDPIALHGGFNGPFGPNWYGYAEGNPLRWTDALGLRPLTVDERSILAPYISARDLNNADIHLGEMPWYAPEWAAGITINNDIYFRDASLDFATPDQLALLGHELVHVGQFADGLTRLGYLWRCMDYDSCPYEKPAYELGNRIRRDLELHRERLSCNP